MSSKQAAEVDSGQAATPDKSPYRTNQIEDRHLPRGWRVAYPLRGFIKGGCHFY
jgi:hypothetical protein